MTDKQRAAAKAALEWLKDEKLGNHTYIDDIQFDKDRDKLAEDLEAALAEPAIKDSLTVAEQEPVAWYHNDFGVLEFSRHERVGWSPLYTATPRKEWVGLKDADFEKEKFVDYNFMAGARFAETKLKEKNG